MADKEDSVDSAGMDLRDVVVRFHLPGSKETADDGNPLNEIELQETPFGDDTSRLLPETQKESKVVPTIIIDPSTSIESLDRIESPVYLSPSEREPNIASEGLPKTEQLTEGPKSSSSAHPGKPTVPEARIKHDPILNKALLKAVSENDMEGVETALMCGANVQAQSPPFFISALHFAAWLGNHEMLEYLISAKSLPNTKDIYGRTPLHLAAAMGHKECVYFLLECGADPNAVTKEIDPSELLPKALVGVVMSCAKAANVNKKYEFDPFLDGFQMPGLDCGCRTPLHEAVKANSPECVTFILAAGGDPNATDSLGVKPLLLAGAGVTSSDLDAISRYEEVVSSLVDQGADANACNPGMGTSALHNAVTLGSISSTVLLLASNADPTWCSTAGGNATVIHEAAANANAQILRLILFSQREIDKRSAMTNLVDSVGRTPLHRAAYVGSRSCISLLLDQGANLGLCTTTGVTAMEALLNHVPRPKRFLFDILDSRIHCNSSTPEELGFILWLDFGILAPDGYERQTSVLNSIIKSKGVSKEMSRSLLGHPMVEAYVRLKWHRLRTFFFSVVAIYAVFVISLSIYVTLEFMYPQETDMRTSGFHNFVLATRYVHLMFALLVLLNVCGQFTANFKYYVRQFETWTNGVSAILSLVLTLAGDFDGIHFPGNKVWLKHCIAVAVPLSWVGLMLLLGRFPLWGSHALLFEAVLKNVLWTFVVLGCIVLGFSFSFFVQFHEKHKAAFGNPWRAFVKTMVMMTGEYEYTTLFEDETKGTGTGKDEVLLGTSRVTFLIFVVVASIVLVNLIVGLAVSDTQALRIEGEARCLHKRAEFVDLLECMVAPIARRQALETRLSFYPNSHSKERSNVRGASCLPRSLVDALSDIAVIKKECELDQYSRKDKVDSWYKNMSNTGKGGLESQVFSMLEKFLRDVTSLMASENRGYNASPNLPRIGSQILMAQRLIRNSQSSSNLAPPIWVQRPLQR